MGKAILSPEKAPLCFLAENRDVKRKAYRLLIQNSDEVKSIWKDQGINDDKIAEIWPSWIRHAGQWLLNIYGPTLRSDMPHEQLLVDLV